MSECFLFIAGYEDRLNDEWLQTREIVYMIYCTATEAKGRENIFEFLPLKGDPSREELSEIKKEKYKKSIEHTNARIKRLIERGVIKVPVKKPNGKKKKNG